MVKKIAKTKTAPVKKPQDLTTKLLIAIIALLVVFSVYLFQRVNTLEKATGLGDTEVQQPPRPTELKIKKPEKADHWRGSRNARYVWVEYSDFECPFCKKIHPDMIRLMEEYKNKVAWIYRHYPLSFHQNAQKQAEATECAAEQGGDEAFWNYTDKIFERTTSNGTGFALEALGPLAAELGMDQVSFQQCLDSNKYEKRVKDQFEEGTKAGIAATPTGVIYDTKTGKNLVVEGAQPYEELKKQLEDFLAKNK